MSVKYQVECFQKKGDKFVFKFDVPKKKINFRRLFNRWNKSLHLDNIKIDKRLKVKLESRLKIKIPTHRYDCYFCEVVEE